MRTCLPFAGLAALALAACAPAAPPLRLRASADMALLEQEGPGAMFEGCWVEAEGRRLSVAQLEAEARLWRGRKVVLQPDLMEVPYKCIGAIVYVLQRTGIARIGFVSEPSARD